MRRSGFLITFALATTVLSTKPASVNAGDVQDLGCKAQVVLIGRVAHVTYEGSLHDWNGLWKLDVEVRRVLRGVERRRYVVAHAAAEAEMRSADNLLFLSPGDDGSYGVLGADIDVGRGLRRLRACK